MYGLNLHNTNVLMIFFIYIIHGWTNKVSYFEVNNTNIMSIKLCYFRVVVYIKIILYRDTRYEIKSLGFQ